MDLTTKNQKISLTILQVLSDTVQESSTIKLLGVALDSPLSMDEHIIRISGICFRNLHKIRSTRKFLDNVSCRTIVQGLVMSIWTIATVYSWDCQFRTLTYFSVYKNAAARLTMNSGSLDSATLALKSLESQG